VAINVTNCKNFSLLHECHALWLRDTSHVEKLTDSTSHAVDNPTHEVRLPVYWAELDTTVLCAGRHIAGASANSWWLFFALQYRGHNPSDRGRGRIWAWLTRTMVSKQRSPARPSQPGDYGMCAAVGAQDAAA
jgi:hypothetical protein